MHRSTSNRLRAVAATFALMATACSPALGATGDPGDGGDPAPVAAPQQGLAQVAAPVEGAAQAAAPAATDGMADADHLMDMPHHDPRFMAQLLAQPECYADHSVSGSLDTQPPPVYCMLTDQPSDTAVRGANSWVDEFDHGVGFATMAGTPYRVFGPFGHAVEGMTWRGGPLKDHWHVDITPDPAGHTGGMVMRPDQSFRFENGRLVVESVFAAAHPEYGDAAWGEMIVTTAPTSTGYRPGALYGYELFPNHWTLGCRLQASRVPICSLMRDVPGGGTSDDVRAWEISFFQHEGATVFGGTPSGNAPWRACAPGAGDKTCRDRFRMELERNSLTLYVNGERYFQQTGLPDLPDELVDGEVYVYFGSMFSRHQGQTLRYHWDGVAVNPDLAPSTPPAPPAPAPPTTQAPATTVPSTAPDPDDGGGSTTTFCPVPTQGS
ncbi:MAG: hypothetical protein AAGD35_12115 [Actinomycetota bacterium]